MHNGKSLGLFDTIGRAPWVHKALREAKAYGGKREDTINERVTYYHKMGGGLAAGSGTAWCASFINYCLRASGFPHPVSASSQSHITSVHMEKCDVFFGAIAVFTDCGKNGNMGGQGHVTFVVGKLPGNETYAVLGGNQGDMIKISLYDCSGGIFHSYGTVYKKFRGFYKPKGYVIKETDKMRNSDNYQSVAIASKTIIKIDSTDNSPGGENSR